MIEETPSKSNRRPSALFSSACDEDTGPSSLDLELLLPLYFACLKPRVKKRPFASTQILDRYDEW